jgi:hypothetical protein
MGGKEEIAEKERERRKRWKREKGWGVTPDERTSGVNFPTGSRPGEPDRLPLKQVILGEGTSGRSPMQGRSPEDSRLGDAGGPVTDRKANVEREANDGGSKRPGHRERGGRHRSPGAMTRSYGGSQGERKGGDSKGTEEKSNRRKSRRHSN